MTTGRNWAGMGVAALLAALLGWQSVRGAGGTIEAAITSALVAGLSGFVGVTIPSHKQPEPKEGGPA